MQPQLGRHGPRRGPPAGRRPTPPTWATTRSRPERRNRARPCPSASDRRHPRMRSPRRSRAAFPRRPAPCPDAQRTGAALAVFTRSPATMPMAGSADGDRGLAGREPPRAATARQPGAPCPGCRTASTRSRAARTARSASSSRATRVPQTAITASPMNFSTEPPWRSISVSAAIEVAVEQRTHILRVACL